MGLRQNGIVVVMSGDDLWRWDPYNFCACAGLEPVLELAVSSIVVST